MNLKFSIRYSRPTLLGKIAIPFYVFMLVVTFQSGRAIHAITAILWALTFQINTGMHIPKSEKP